MEVYRIVQIADERFIIEQQASRHYLKWPWSKPVITEVWERGAIQISSGLTAQARIFPTQADAQKWVDDKRVYPFVVKSPA